MVHDQNIPNKMKIFAIAFACEPERPSEPGIGWSVVGELVKSHDLTVLTRANNREVIERYLEKHPDDNHNRIDWKYFDLWEWFHKLKKRLPGGIQLYHELWQLFAARKFRDSFKEYDIVHHLIFGGVFFTPWAARYSKRFVWGPIGGALGAMEPSFLKKESKGAFFGEWLYGMVSRYSYRPLGFVRKLRDKATAILFRTSELAGKLALAPGQFSAVVPESAYEGDVAPKTYADEIHPLRMVSIGRIVTLKGLYYTIMAFARYIRNGGSGDYHIFGDGPLKDEMARLAEKEGVSGYVVFHGNVPHAKVLESLKGCDVLLHGSFREGASWTILEGMANGLPVVCQARAGMVDMVPPDCGTPIKAASPDELIEAMSSAMMDYYRNPGLVKKHGTAGAERVAGVYRWPAIVSSINEMYSRVMEK